MVVPNIVGFFHPKNCGNDSHLKTCAYFSDGLVQPSPSNQRIFGWICSFYLIPDFCGRAGQHSRESRGCVPLFSACGVFGHWAGRPGFQWYLGLIGHFFQGSLNYLFGGDKTMQMYGRFEGISH